MKTILRVVACLIFLENAFILFLGYAFCGFMGGMPGPTMSTFEAYGYVIYALGLCVSLLVLKLNRIGIALAMVIYFISWIYFIRGPIWLNGIYFVGAFTSLKYLLDQRKLTKQNL